MSERVVSRKASGTLAAEAVATPPLGKRRSGGATPWRRFLHNHLAVGAVIVLVALALTTLVVPLVVSSDKVTAQVRNATFAPPSADARRT